jgi:hypothetical protein
MSETAHARALERRSINVVVAKPAALFRQVASGAET